MGQEGLHKNPHRILGQHQADETGEGEAGERKNPAENLSGNPTTPATAANANDVP